MRLFVMGGAGFLGSHVVDLLVGQGHDVTVLDNLSTGLRENLHADARFVEQDICAPELESTLRRANPSVVLHLAAQVSVPTSLERPDHDLAVNLGGTVNLIQASAKAGVEKIVTISSAAVYGTPTALPLREESPTRPLSPYGLSKLAGEEYVRMLCTLHGLHFTILRPANIYGPRQRAEGDGAVIPAFLNRFLNGADPIINGDGGQTRDFIYVTDMAEAIAQAATRAHGLTLNVSTGTAVSVRELWSSLADLIGWERPPKFGPARQGDILHSLMANDAARQALEWGPSVSLNTGLERTVEWARADARLQQQMEQFR